MHVHTRRPPLTLWAWHFNTNASIQAALAPQNCSGAFLFLKIILCGRACNYLRFFCCCIVLCFPVCLAAEVVPQRAAHRAGEEGGAGCTLPECEMPFLMFSHILTELSVLIELVFASFAWDKPQNYHPNSAALLIAAPLFRFPATVYSDKLSI